MAGRGKGRGRGRGRGKAKTVLEKESENDEGSVPELDVPPPPSMTSPVRTSVRLNSTSSVHSTPDKQSDDNEVEAMETDLSLAEDTEEKNGVQNGEEKLDGTVEDAEMVSEEETFTSQEGGVSLGTEAVSDGEGEGEAALGTDAVSDAEGETQLSTEPVSDGDAEATLGTEAVSDGEGEEEGPLDTEAVSEDELKVESQGVLETEAVSDDELPQEKRKKAKVAEAEAVSEDELSDEGEKKGKRKAKGAGDGEQEGGEAARKEGGKRKMPDGEYDPSSPTSEHSGDGNADGGPAAKKAALGDKSPTPNPAGKKPLPELEKYWKVVRDDPSDFTGWTYLLQYVDQENDIEVAREAYDTFLSHYPYCYGYWRKYADLEKRKGFQEHCEQVFERGLKAIPLSVDLWVHYINYCKGVKTDESELRSQYDRAIDACGLEFRSDRLWEGYIKWEKEKKNLTNITSIYDRLLSIPTQGYTTHFDTFQDHVNANPPQTILPVDEFLELRREVVAELKLNEKPAPPSAMEEAPPGEEMDPSKEDDSAATATLRMEEETSALRQKILALRRKVHKATVAAVASRWNYEEGIKRPYFHVKPLERCQLKNWKEYLDYEIEQGDHKRITVLFERCLIACALYEEFWVRLIRYLESVKGEQTDRIRDVYERACLIHHKKKPNLHLQWAVFEETHGCFDKAAEILERLETTSPNMLQVAYRRINLERRRGEYAEAAKLYEHYITSTYANNKPTLTNMTVKYARFTWKFLNDIDKAISILERALESDKDNTRLYLQLIDMALQKSPVDEDRIVAILDQFLAKEGDLDQKVMFAQRKIEFLEDFGSSIERVQKAQDDFQKYIKQVKDKKKKSEAAEPPPPAQPPTPTSYTKKAKSEAVPPISSNAGPPMPTAPPPNNYPPPASYPPNYYGQYPPPTGDQGNYQGNYPAGYNNYSNWNNYPQGNYQNYGQSGWPGYYPTNY